MEFYCAYFGVKCLVLISIALLFKTIFRKRVYYEIFMKEKYYFVQTTNDCFLLAITCQLQFASGFKTAFT